MNLVLFITVITVSFIVVRIGAIAFQLTGLEWSVAKFQALSCFSSTGFTTSEAELIVKDRQRRRIASILIVLGHAGLVTMIATLANSLRAQRVIEEKLTKSLIPSIPPMFVPYVNLGVIIFVLYLLYKFSTSSMIARRLTNYLRAKIIKKELIQRVSYEQLMLATGGYGIARLNVCAGSPVVDKTLAESALRSQDITILAITRGGKTTANPTADMKILLNDELLCFGKLENVKSRICTTTGK
jgi:hypothetical protein